MLGLLIDKEPTNMQALSLAALIDDGVKRGPSPFIFSYSPASSYVAAFGRGLHWHGTCGRRSSCWRNLSWGSNPAVSSQLITLKLGADKCCSGSAYTHCFVSTCDHFSCTYTIHVKFITNSPHSTLHSAIKKHLDNWWSRLIEPISPVIWWILALDVLLCVSGLDKNGKT